MPKELLSLGLEQPGQLLIQFTRKRFVSLLLFVSFSKVMLVLFWAQLLSILIYSSWMFTAVALPSRLLRKQREDDELYAGQISTLPGATLPINLTATTTTSGPSRTQNTFTDPHTYYHLPTGFTHLRFSYGAPIDRRIFSTLVADARKEINSQWKRYGDSEVPPGSDPFIDTARYNTRLLIQSCGEACRLKYGLLKDIMTALALFLVDEKWFYETQFGVFNDLTGQLAEGSITRPAESSIIPASDISAHATWATS